MHGHNAYASLHGLEELVSQLDGLRKIPGLDGVRQW